MKSAIKTLIEANESTIISGLTAPSGDQYALPIISKQRLSTPTAYPIILITVLDATSTPLEDSRLSISPLLFSVEYQILIEIVDWLIVGYDEDALYEQHGTTIERIGDRIVNIIAVTPQFAGSGTKKYRLLEDNDSPDTHRRITKTIVDFIDQSIGEPFIPVKIQEIRFTLLDACDDMSSGV